MFTVQQYAKGHKELRMFPLINNCTISQN